MAPTSPWCGEPAGRPATQRGQAGQCRSGPPGCGAGQPAGELAPITGRSSWGARAWAPSFRLPRPGSERCGAVRSPGLDRRSFLRLADGTAASLEALRLRRQPPRDPPRRCRWGRPTPVRRSLDLRAAQPGDRCQARPEPASWRRPAASKWATSSSWAASIPKPWTPASPPRAGADEALWMGCYGIGVSGWPRPRWNRITTRNGICWPVLDRALRR